MENYIFKSNITISRVLFGIFILFPLLLIIFTFAGSQDFQRDIWLICIIDLVVNYLVSFYTLSIHYFYESHLLIKYPTRIVKRSILVKYDNISKAKYVRGPKGTTLFYIFFNCNDKSKTSSFNFMNLVKMKLLFSFLLSKNINIELNLWGNKSLYKGGDLPKF